MSAADEIAGTEETTDGPIGESVQIGEPCATCGHDKHRHAYPPHSDRKAVHCLERIGEQPVLGFTPSPGFDGRAVCPCELWIPIPPAMVPADAPKPNDALPLPPPPAPKEDVQS